MASNLPASKEKLNFLQRIRLNRIIKQVEHGKDVSMSTLPDYIRKNSDFLSAYAAKGKGSDLSLEDYANLSSYSTRLLEERTLKSVRNRKGRKRL